MIELFIQLLCAHLVVQVALPRHQQPHPLASRECTRSLQHYLTVSTNAASQHQATGQLQKSPTPATFQQQWNEEAPALLTCLGVPTDLTPQQLWQHFSTNSSTEEQQQQLQQQLQQHLEPSSCRLLLRAAAATCSTQQQYNSLRSLIQAATTFFPCFELSDFQLLLRLCAQARHVPDKDWLAAAIYADTGGIERLYQQVRIWLQPWHLAILSR